VDDNSTIATAFLSQFLLYFCTVFSHMRFRPSLPFSLTTFALIMVADCSAMHTADSLI